MKKFIVVIDTQYDFMMEDGRLPVAGAEALIAPGIRFLANLKPEETAGVLFTFDTHTEKDFIGSPENLGNPDAGEPGFPLHCEKGTPGWENVFNPKMVPADIPVFTLEKGVFNMWEEKRIMLNSKSYTGDFSIERETLFQKMKPEESDGIKADVIQIFGVASDFCVRWAVDGFLKRGFKVEVIEHLTAGILKTMAEVAAEDDYKAVTLV